MPFADRLVAEPQREKSGETGAQRYDYQALWGLTLVFAHHAASSDYAISFEFHDDIVLLNSSSAPTKASFYQVKTKSKGHWTLTELTNRKKRKNDPNNSLLPSHVGKLYSNYAIFPNETDKLAFVSNVPCQFFDAAATDCYMSDAQPNVLPELTTKLQAEYPTASATIVDQLFHFVRADLSLRDSSAHIKGKLIEFVHDQLGPTEFNPDSVYKTIVEECRLRSKYTGSILNFDELIRRKSITKIQVDGWLKAIELAHSTPSWNEIAIHLDVLDVLAVAELSREWKRYRAVALDSNDLAVNLLRDKIRIEIDACSGLGLPLQDLLAKIYPSVEPFATTTLPIFKPARLKVMIIYEVFTHDPSGTLQATNPQPANA